MSIEVDIAKSEDRPKRSGRKTHTMVDIFKRQAWVSLLGCCAGTSKASELAKIFGTGNDTRIWDKYVKCVHTPLATPNSKGKESIAMIVGKKFPGTLTILVHPIWDAMACEKVTVNMLVKMFENFDSSTAAYYRSILGARDSDPPELYCALLGKIWIEASDYIAALDHLAANLMLYRSDLMQLNESARGIIAENVVKTLGPLSKSPWFFLFYEEFFDYLEQHIWGNLFDYVYHESLQDGLGWRKTQNNWIPSVHCDELIPEKFNAAVIAPRELM